MTQAGCQSLSINYSWHAIYLTKHMIRFKCQGSELEGRMRRPPSGVKDSMIRFNQVLIVLTGRLMKKVEASYRSGKRSRMVYPCITYREETAGWLLRIIEGLQVNITLVSNVILMIPPLGCANCSDLDSSQGKSKCLCAYEDEEVMHGRDTNQKKMRNG